MAKTPTKSPSKKPAAKAKPRKPEAPKRDLYAEITNKIIASLEAGVRPWAKPWTVGKEQMGVTPVRPQRFNGQPYSGINVFLLWNAAMDHGFVNPTWMTFQQAIDLKGHVRKGEKGETVVYANKFLKDIKDEKTGEDKKVAIPFLKAYTVFNVEQIDDLPERFYLKPEPVTPAQAQAAKIERVTHADAFIANLGADIRHGGAQAFYSPQHDFIKMPEFSTFNEAEAYYATLGHEAVHWTRHESRLKRDFGRERWGDTGYAREELVAELGAAFLCADLGLSLDVRDDHAAYIANWLKVLENDKRFIFKAATFATKAVEYLHAANLSAAAGEPDDTDLGEDSAANENEMRIAA